MGDQPKIELQDVLNPSEGRFEYIGEDTLVSRVGGALFFLSLSSQKQHALRFPAGYALDAWAVSNQTPTGQGEQQVVVALSGPDTRIHVYSWPRLHLEQSFLADEDVCYTRLALSRDGRFLVGVSSESHVHLRFWDLQAPDIDIRISDDDDAQTNRLLRDRDVHLVLQEEMTFLSFNPFNHTQLVVGNERSIQVVTVTAATSFQLATLTPMTVNFDATNLNTRRIASLVWLSDRQLLLATHSGEILSCAVQTPPSILAMRERDGAQQTSGGAESPVFDRSISGGNSTPGGVNPRAASGPAAGTTVAAGGTTAQSDTGLANLTDADLALLGLVDTRAPSHLHTDWKGVEGVPTPSLSVVTWTNHLPAAPENDDVAEAQPEDGGLSARARNSAPIATGGVGGGAVAICMALTRHELVVGTSDGCLLWLNRHTQTVTHQQHIDVSSGDTGVLAIAFSPSYATFVALTRRGHLRLFKPLSDRAAPPTHAAAAAATEDDPDSAAAAVAAAQFQTSSLGHFPVASALAAELSPTTNFATLPSSLLRTRTPVRVGHVLVPTHPSDLHPRNFRLVSYTSRGLLQLWCYGARQLLGTYHFRSGVTSVAVSLDGHLAVVGLDSGVVNIVDISNPAYMRLVFSQRMHSGPVLAIEFNREGDIFSTLGPRKVFFVRAGDFRVVAYTKIDDWNNNKTNDTAAAAAAAAETSTSPLAAESGSAAAPSPSSSSDPAFSFAPRSPEAEAIRVAEVAVQLERAKNDDEPEFEGDETASSSSATSAVSTTEKDAEPRDTLIAMCWSTPVDREKLPNDRLLISTRQGRVYVLTAPNSYHDATELRLDDEFLQVVSTSVSSPLLALQANLSDRTLIYATSESKMLQVYSLQYDSTLKLERAVNDDVPSEDVEEVGPDRLLHQRACTVISQALTGNLLVTSGGDGLIVLRDGESLEYLTRVPVHDYVVGGACSVGIAPDSTLLTTSGFDGALLVFDLAPLAPLIGTRRTRKLKALPQVIQAKVLAQLSEVEESGGASDPCYLATHARATGGTLLKERDLQQKILKDELHKSLHAFKLQFNEILERNARLPDLERLGYSDFAIDVELKEHLTREGEARVAAVREQIRSECVGKEYIIDRIKAQCWTAMEVKGMMFTAFRSDLEVHNYPVRALAPKESRRIRQVQFLRRMEVVEKRWRHNQTLKADEADVTDRSFTPQKYTEDSATYLMNLEHEKPDDTHAKEGEKKEGEKKSKDASKDASGAARQAKKDATSSTAAKSATHISGDMPLENLPRFLLYHPLDVITPLKKRTQALLLQVKIEQLKKSFNDLFADFYQVKQREIDHIHEKAKRIQEIQNELQMDVPVYRPMLAPEEIATSVLSVDDSEITAKKVLSKAERAIADAKAERDRLSSTNQDDGPERALEVMMGGTLETKRDLSLLEQELIPEEWMKTLAPDQMTEEQKAELAKFDKKVKMIQAEQETRRKLLQTELSKLKSDVSEIAKTFDAKLRTQLAEQRINVQREMYQHELMIIKMLNDLLVEEEKAKEEREVGRKVTHLQSAIQVSRDLRGEFERTYRSSQSQYESMQAELKSQDRQFRRDLQNGGISVEQQQALAAEAAAQAAAQQQIAAEQAAQIAAGELVDEEGRPLVVTPPPPPAPVVLGAGENLESLYKLFRARKASKTKAGGKKGGTLGGTGAPKMQIDAITGRAVRVGSGLGRLGLLGTLTGPVDLSATGDLRRTGSREGPVAGSGAAALRRRKKDSDEDAGDGTMNPYPSDLLAHLASQTSGAAPSGPNLALLEDIKYLDLDDRDRPESVDVDLWYALLARRQEYIEKERDVRRYHYKLQEMALHLTHLQAMETALDQELRALTHYQSSLVEARTIFALNTEVMLRIQQGQVEIEESPVVTDLKDCEMIDRVQVEKLNTVIKRQGSEKVDILKDTTVSRTAINLLEWTRKKLELEHADSVDLTTELQLLRVTKSLQGLIKMGGHDNQKAAELKSLDRKIEFVSAANRDSLLGKKLKLMKVRKRIKQQTRENERLYETVQELEAAVKERMQISSIRDEGRLEESRAGKERMKALVTRRKLVDLAKLQSEEIKFLRDQVENLRRRTFASFAIPQLPPNPDERARSSYGPTRPTPPPPRGGLLPPAPRPQTTLPGLGRDGTSARPTAAATTNQLPPLR